MPLFTIGTPDGRELDIEAPDEATAIRGAQEWTTANPKPFQLQGKVEFGSSPPVLPSENVEFRGPTAQQSYDKALATIRQKYYPWADDAKWQEIIARPGWAPRTAGELFDPTFGLSDEARGASGALGNLLSGQNPLEGFVDFQSFEQARRALGQEQSGALGTAAEVGSALLSGRPDMAATRVTGFIPSVIKGATDAAKQGAIYGFASTEGDLADRARGAVQSGAFAAPFGAAVPAVAAGVRKVISPVRAPTAKTAASQVLQREGVELTAGQATGNKGLQYREAELGGTAAESFMERQADQFTSAVLKRAGVQATRATPQVLDQAFDDIGQQFDDLAARNNLTLDVQLGQDMRAVFDDYTQLVPASQRAPVVDRIRQDVIDIVRQGGTVMDGSAYQALRSRLDRLARGTSDPQLANALRGLRTALDDAMERSLAVSNPADLGAWREARRLYRNVLVIEDAATRMGEKSADGIITPQAIRSAAIKQNKRAFARGRNEFTDLANAGVSTMTPLPNSGTPGRIGARLFMPAGAVAGAGLGSALGPVGTVLGGVAGASVPWAAGRAMLSGIGRRYLGNQLAAGPVTGIASMLGASAGRGAQPLLSRP